jgi:hypothetical protein
MERNYNSVLENTNKILLGLALLEPELRSQFEEKDKFSKIIERFSIPIEDLLTDKGLSYYFNSADSVPNLNDEPLEDIADDMLGRVAFARYLVKRITKTKFQSGAYSIHLYGPWGSGKSTIMNFIKKELNSEDTKKGLKVKQEDNIKEDSKPKEPGKTEEEIWLVAEFNAWRHQHINPPWWPLYVHMYNEMRKKLNIWKQMREWYWRLSAGQLGYVFLLVLVFWLVNIVFHYIGTEKNPKAWAEAADAISKIIALITTLAGAIIVFIRSFHFGSARAAKSFEEYAQDPMNAIKERFGKLIKSLPKKVRLMVLIDDLDRCKSDYVVALLEGIQTMFRQGNIVFIVAADKKWINACFVERYTNLRDMIKEPGKPLGTLFLEKTFQLCTPVPGIPKELKNEFWQQLLSLKTKNIILEMEQARNTMRANIEETKEEAAIIKKINESKDDNKPIHEQLAIRAEAVIQLASPDVMQRTEHTLKKFAPLLDDNPRAMKRFVNAYSVNRALSTLSFSDIELNDLAQWTIFTLRWPQLAEYLTKNPDTIDKNITVNQNGMDDNIRQLLKDEDVKKVMEGNGITGLMDKKTIIACSHLV